MSDPDRMLQRSAPPSVLRASALRRSAGQRLAFVAAPIVILWALVALVLWA